MSHRTALLSALMFLGLLLGATPALAAEGVAPVPGQLEFGSVDMHFGGSPRQSVQFSNGSPSAVLLGSAEISGADASAFQIVGNGCSPRQLEPAESCSIEVEFHSASGAQSASLELLAGEATIAVPLSGSGITGTLSAGPDPLSFNAIPYSPPGHEGENQETEQVNVLNSLDAGTQIESVSITGPDASSFSIQYGNCEHNLLAPGNSCDEAVRFAPGSPGPKSASLVMSGDSSGGPLIVPLEGEALHGPQISVASTQALLGDVLLGASAEHTFTLTNTGDYPLFIQQDFLISGTPLMFPIVFDGCSGQILGTGDSCELTVGFEPSTRGEKDASIVLITNASPIHVLGVDGVGIAPALASTPALSSPFAPAPAEQPTPPIVPAAAALAADAHRDAPQSVAVAQAPRLYGSIARAALDTGFVARCPAALANCEAVSFITASIPTRSKSGPALAHSSTPVLLGSALSRLRGGQSTHVRIPLSQHAIALLREHRRLRARIETIVRAGASVVATRARVATLTRPDSAARVR